MPDFLLLMHDDGGDPASGDADPWAPYLAGLRASGRLQGGSAIGAGICLRKTGTAPPISRHLTGFIRVSASDVQDAQTLLPGNPVFEAGGTVEIRELPVTG